MLPTDVLNENTVVNNSRKGSFIESRRLHDRALYSVFYALVKQPVFATVFIIYPEFATLNTKMGIFVVSLMFHCTLIKAIKFLNKKSIHFLFYTY